MDFSKKLNSLSILQKVLSVLRYVDSISDSCSSFENQFGQNYLFPKISKIANNHSILIETNF